MKKLFGIIVLVALCVGGYFLWRSPSHNLVVNYKGLTNDTVFLSTTPLSEFLSSPGMEGIDTLILKHGKLKLNIDVSSEPIFFCIYSMDYRHNESGRRWLRPSGEIQNILYPDQPLHIDAVSADGYISTTVKEGNQVNKDISSVKSEFRKYQCEYEDLIWGTYEGVIDARKKDAKKAELKELLSTTHSNFIESFPARKASAFFLTYLKDMAEYASVVDDSIFEGEFAPVKPQLDRAVIIDKAKEVYKLESDGMTMKTLAGEDVSKATVAGKYVVLYFWGTHQGSWLKGMPKLIELKGKYGDKFMAVIVNCRDNDPALWQKELKQKGLKWGDLFDKYAGNSYPTKVVLSPAGEVLGVYVNQTSGYNISFAYDLDDLLR